MTEPPEASHGWQSQPCATPGGVAAAVLNLTGLGAREVLPQKVIRR
jgi:hypothetical protein